VIASGVSLEAAQAARRTLVAAGAYRDVLIEPDHGPENRAHVER